MMACVQVRVETWACGNARWGFAPHAHCVFAKDEKQRSDIELGGPWALSRLVDEGGSRGTRADGLQPTAAGEAAGKARLMAEAVVVVVVVEVAVGGGVGGPQS